MLQPIISPAQLWPGGIPATVRLHPEGDLNDKDAQKEIQGWNFGLPLSDPEEDRAQRRALIEKWASADQSFRDSYFSDGPLVGLHDFNGSRYSKSFVCLVDKPYNPENYSRITKILILLYIHLQRSLNHPLSHNCSSDDQPQLPAFMLDPATETLSTNDYARLLAGENLPVTYYLETADFEAMAMTSTGTVIFPYLDDQAYLVIDNQSCEDGRLLLLNFSCTGQILHQARMIPFQIGALTLFHGVLGHLWEELFKKGNARPGWNKPFDIHLPLVEIMAVLIQRGDLFPLNDYTPAEWAEEFERFAPEYLAYERQGRVIEYSWDRLADVTEEFSTYNHLRYDRQLADMSRRGPV
ncbi:hypothetical protein N7520_003544 [Penicillium odoratum]|uniref:uncharacterized protein n=1 Tax=Penicillium odoratum TaxID=1167516 RepID=UPI0025476190|nr:uncharacterized protein N7520_003544 [Penicillium odoratum]KAJ5768985.1 hypothetical protein N7520_003544 [Penicillium odoratum]